MSAPVGPCCICGCVGQLTFEHVPPKAAFNDRGVLYRKISDFLESGSSTDPRTLPNRKSNRGAGDFTLCAKCNNDTGAWYGSEYVSWIKQCMEHKPMLFNLNMQNVILPFSIYPSRIAKQLICMFASSCGHGFLEANHDLRRIVLNPSHAGIPEKFRLYAFLMSSRSTSFRRSGIVSTMNFNVRDSVRVFSEISYPPFGFILTIDSIPIDEELSDITYFSDYPYKEKAELFIRMPFREVNSYFPGDFRTVEEWEAAIREGLASSE